MTISTPNFTSSMIQHPTGNNTVTATSQGYILPIPQISAQMFSIKDNSQILMPLNETTGSKLSILA